MTTVQARVLKKGRAGGEKENGEVIATLGSFRSVTALAHSVCFYTRTRNKASPQLAVTCPEEMNGYMLLAPD